MTREECKGIVMIMSATYPNYKPVDLSMTVDIWNEILADYNFDDIKAALKSYIATDTSGFAPGVSNLISIASMLQNPLQLNDMQAWSLVSRAIQNGYYGAEKEFERLPTVVQKSVGSASQLREWSQMDFKSLEIAQSNFMRVYNAEVKRTTQINNMPQEIRDRISQLNPEPVKIEDKGSEIPEPEKEIENCDPFEKIEELKRKWNS